MNSTFLSSNGSETEDDKQGGLRFVPARVTFVTLLHLHVGFVRR